MDVKRVFKGTRKRDIEIEPLDSTNIRRFIDFIHKFATCLNEWMLSGETELSRQIFSCLQTSQSSSLLIQHLIRY